jgi:hypothetical protein
MLGCGGASSRPTVTINEETAELTAVLGPSGGVVEASGNIWFVFGATFGMGLFVFVPATSTTQAVSLPGHGEVQVGFDGTHIIVFAQPTQGGPDRNIFPVRSAPEPLRAQPAGSSSG